MAAGSLLHSARVDSVRLQPPSGGGGATRSSQMAPQRTSGRWQVSEGWRDAAVPAGLTKQLWGLICPTPPPGSV